MKRFGAMLRALREQWGFTLRDVEKQTKLLAQRVGDPRYAFSYGHLGKLERGAHDLKVTSLVSLSHVLSQEPSVLLKACVPRDLESPIWTVDEAPNTTVLIKEGHLYEKAERLAKPMRDALHISGIPDDTTLIPNDIGGDDGRYLKAVVGKRDGAAFYPMIFPGSAITVDTHQRRILSSREYTNERTRPIYFLQTREKEGKYLCGWCQLSAGGTVLHVISHLYSGSTVRSFNVNSEIDILGRILETTNDLTAGGFTI